MANMYIRMDANEVSELYRIIELAKTAGDIPFEEGASIMEFLEEKARKDGSIQTRVSVSEQADAALRGRIEESEGISEVAKLFLESRRIRFSVDRHYADEFFRLLEESMDTDTDMELVAIHRRKLEDTDNTIQDLADMEEPPRNMSGIFYLPIYYIEKMRQLVDNTDCEKCLGYSGMHAASTW